MTFSLVARAIDDAGRPTYGVAVASKFLAVGALVPAASAAAGALATQSLANLTYRPAGLELLRAGAVAQEVVDRLTGVDPQAEHRQLGVVGSTGQGATFTGSGCEPWAGGEVADGLAVQGNCLAGATVVADAVAAFQDAEGSLADRLVAGLAAGDAAGGDKRGRQSAALLVVTPGGGYGGGSDVLVDLRVDDAASPLPELQRLLALHRLYAGPASDVQPLEGALGAEVVALLARVGAPDLRRWMELENYEERWTDDGIDGQVLDALRTAAG